MPPATSNNIIGSSNNAKQSMESPKCYIEKSIGLLLKICLEEKLPVHKNINKRIVSAIQ